MKPKYFSLSCIDYRIPDDIYDILGNENYDEFTIAGASLGMNINSQWRETLFQNIDLAIQLHSIDTVVIFDHQDCGYYEHIYGSDKFEDHLTNLKLAKKLIENEYKGIKVILKYITVNKSH